MILRIGSCAFGWRRRRAGLRARSVSYKLHEGRIRKPGRVHLVPDSKEAAEAHDQRAPFFRIDMRVPMSPRNIARDSLHPILKKMGRELAGFHTFRRFRESILQMSEARTLLIDFWMGHANREMSGRYGKQLLDNVQWRRDCAAKVGLGFTLPTEEEQPLMDKSGQVLEDEGQEEVAA